MADRSPTGDADRRKGKEPDDAKPEREAKADKADKPEKADKPGSRSIPPPAPD